MNPVNLLDHKKKIPNPKGRGLNSQDWSRKNSRGKNASSTQIHAWLYGLEDKPVQVIVSYWASIAQYKAKLPNGNRVTVHPCSNNKKLSYRKGCFSLTK